ncbi:MAG: hypothetical protein ACI81L_003496 [Verrucomicrobiales bacterium]|jgi:hypothetical protein
MFTRPPGAPPDRQGPAFEYDAEYPIEEFYRPNVVDQTDPTDPVELGASRWRCASERFGQSFGGVDRDGQSNSAQSANKRRGKDCFVDAIEK